MSHLGPVDQAARSPETGVAFARSYARGVETAIAFAGEKKLYFVHFSVAVVPAVSCWPASVAAEASLVSKLARGRVLCAKKFALRGLMVGASAKKFAQQAQNDRKPLFSGALGELFRGSVGGGAVLGEFFRGNAGGWVTLGELFRACCGKGRHSDGFLSKRAVF